MKKVQTWLPVFSGFYNTIWEADESNEIDYINEQRTRKGLVPITSNDCRFDYGSYNIQVCQRLTSEIAAVLIKEGFVKSIEFERINSPKEYNFKNDSVNIIVTLTKKNSKAILSFLDGEANEGFIDYLIDNYTGYDGFIPHYPNTVAEFMKDAPLEHPHKLGAILNFICSTYEDLKEWHLYESVTGGISLSCENYEELVNGTEPAEDEN